MADVSEMLGAIEDALAGPRGPKGTVLPVHSPQVLGVKAKPLGMSEPVTDAEGRVIVPARPLYGLTRRGCRKVRAIIHAAARADLGQDDGTRWDRWFDRQPREVAYLVAVAPLIIIGVVLIVAALVLG